MRRVLPLVLLLVLVAVVLALLGGGGEPARPAAPTPPPRAAQPAGVDAHLRALAGAARRGGGTRAAGTAGDRLSVAYVEGRLRRAGYRVWRERVPFPFFAVRTPPRVTNASGVRALQFSPGGDAAGRVRRVGLACASEALAPLARGEVALAQRGTCTFRRKAQLAQAAGASALLVADEGGAPAGSLGSPGIRIPVVGLGAQAARGLPARVEVRLRTTSETRATHNVLAERPEGAADRLVMAGAHLDSVPEGPGLNDNGSGVAALLDVAERAPAGRARPGDARLRFAFWGAEELGLVGSRRHVQRLSPAQRRAIVAYLNLDMVGSPRARPAVYRAADGDVVAGRLERLLRAGLERRGVEPREESLGGASDHAPFARAGIPVGGLFTGADRATDPCYHRACDGLGNVDEAMTATMAGAARDALTRLRRPAA